MRRTFVAVTAALALIALLAGVADAGGGKPKNVKKAKADIEDAYECFLSGALGYTIEQKAACVQDIADDPALLDLARQVDAANAGASAMTEPVINKITFSSPKQADVSFDLVVGGEVLGDIAPPGEAVLVKEDGKKVWKVSLATFCKLSVLGFPAAAAQGPCAAILVEG